MAVLGYFFHMYVLLLVCPPGGPTFHLDDGLFISNVHRERCTLSMHCVVCYLSTLRAHRLSTVMPTDAFCRKGSSLHRKSPKKLLANGQPIARSCTTIQTHTHSQVSVTAHAGGVLSVALWDILVTVITVTLSLPKETPNTTADFCGCRQTS